MRTDKTTLMDTARKTIETRLNASDLSYLEVQILEQYVIIQQNEEIIKLLKQLNAK